MFIQYAFCISRRAIHGSLISGSTNIPILPSWHVLQHHPEFSKLLSSATWALTTASLVMSATSSSYVLLHSSARELEVTLASKLAISPIRNRPHNEPKKKKKEKKKKRQAGQLCCFCPSSHDNIYFDSNRVVAGKKKKKRLKRIRS